MIDRKKRIILVILIGILIISIIFVKGVRQRTMEKNGLKLVWADEFEAPDGSAIDDTKWNHDIGGEGWGNQEKQYYTEDTPNCYIQDNMLVIEAKEEQVTEKNLYTSARITTKDKYEFTYGRVEMRAKIPYGQGIWPAFWMLGADIDENPWPVCGEIDIMENIGKEPNIVHGTVHGPGYSGSMGIGNAYEIEQPYTQDFHVYAIEWKEDEIKWYMDDVLYHTMNPNKTIGNKWVYNHDFYILLNLAVGGEWPGYPDKTTTLPQKYIIDYVRVYQ